jgi:hypothetical protein
MHTELRVLIFGLSRSTTQEEILRLLGHCGPVTLDLRPIPGDNDDAFAVVHVAYDRQLADHLAQGISTRHLHGRKLQSWVPAMAWS